MTKPVVHHVITRLIAGGAQENTLLSCQALLDRYEILLITGPPEGPEGSLVEDARRRGIEVLVLDELVRPVSPPRDLAAFARLRGIFESGHPDIVHTHSSKAGILGRAAAWTAKVRSSSTPTMVSRSTASSRFRHAHSTGVSRRRRRS